MINESYVTFISQLFSHSITDASKLLYYKKDNQTLTAGSSAQNG